MIAAILREHHLLQLENQGSPSSAADNGNRDISLPLQRFISDMSSPSLIQPVDFVEMDNDRLDNCFGHVESPLIQLPGIRNTGGTIAGKGKVYISFLLTISF